MRLIHVGERMCSLLFRVVNYRGEFDADSDIIRAFCQEILSTVQEVVVLNPLLRDRLTFFSERSIDVYNPFKLADLAATISAGTPEQLQAVLAEPSAEGRLRLALDIISKVQWARSSSRSHGFVSVVAFGDGAMTRRMELLFGSTSACIIP